MKTKGLERDDDIAGLTALELEQLMTGFIDDEEAAWYVQVAPCSLQTETRLCGRCGAGSQFSCSYPFKKA